MIDDRYKSLTTRSRIEGFQQAFDHYKAEKASQPLPEERKFQVFDSSDQSASLRIRLQRASLIRKFVLGDKDAFYLLKIHICVEELAMIPIDHQSSARLKECLDVLESGNVGPIGIVENSSGLPTPDSQIVDDALNGVLLHSDPDKMNRHNSRNSTSVNLAVFSWLLQAEMLCEIMQEMVRLTIEKLPPG